jgi:hypothetical protein
MRDLLTKDIGQYIRSPLGIIGLFVTLIYGISSWLFSGILTELDHSLQKILVGFIVLYPLILLAAFIFLVTKHHTKLYAPKDFRDDSNFLQYSSNNSIKDKIDEYDPSLAKKLENIESEAKEETIEAVTNVLGKESLALNLATSYFAQRYGLDNVRRESFIKQTLDHGYDLIVRSGPRERIMVEVKFLSKKSQINKIIDQAIKATQLVNQMDMSGSSKERSYLLFALVDASNAEIKKMQESFESLIKQRQPKISYELHNYAEIAKKYIDTIQT